MIVYKLRCLEWSSKDRDGYLRSLKYKGEWSTYNYYRFRNNEYMNFGAGRGYHFTGIMK